MTPDFDTATPRQDSINGDVSSLLCFGYYKDLHLKADFVPSSSASDSQKPDTFVLTRYAQDFSNNPLPASCFIDRALYQ